MIDTHPAAAARFKKLMKAKSNSERLLMGCSMYDAARKIVESAIYNYTPEIISQELKEKVFLRFYGMEFNKSKRKKILAVLKNTMLA